MPSDGCFDCDRPYGDKYGFPDLIVPNWAWELITPAEHSEGGLLCPSCICSRLTKLGLQGVPFAFRSGPLVIGEIDLNAPAPENLQSILAGSRNRPDEDLELHVRQILWDLGKKEAQKGG